NIDGVGLEFNDRAVEECQAIGLNVQKLSIENFAAKNPEKFDAVVLFQVLEHVCDVSAFISNLLACLKKGGKLIFAVPDNSPFYKNFRIHLTMNLPPHHMGLWNAESFKSLEKVFPISLTSVEYDDDYSSIPKYVYFYGDLLVTRYAAVYNNFLLRNLLIVLLVPYTLPVVLKMRLRSELRPHSIIATFAKNS
ncbi:MAG: class I SAM-dependent methyltransferase, partial [Pyrinomonadaceae bacterium]